MKDPRVFVLGVYASAVHAWWLNLDGSTRVVALAAASEPHIFWGGEGETEIIASIQVPAEADHLVLPGAQLTLVLFAGEVLSSGGKISKPMIRFIIEANQRIVGIFAAMFGSGMGLARTCFKLDPAPFLSK